LPDLRADLQQQLETLRRRVARIDRKYSAAAPSPAPRPVDFIRRPGTAEPIDSKTKPERYHLHEWASGEVVENEFGSHYQMERLYESHRRHGSADIGALAELPETLLDAIGTGEIPPSAPHRWAFLDTETTGLAGGSGTYAFLIGVGRICPDGFRVRQFFMREYSEEKSLLAALTAHLAEFGALVTYNGKTYDQPLLETRYRMNRDKPPFTRLPHLDLLHGSRRLWKLRFESCRLVHLEQQILGVERQGDLPGELIPYVYFEYLRNKEAERLVPIFHHNAVDILTLACLTAIVPTVFRNASDCASLERLGLRRGDEMVGIARWLLAEGESEQGLTLLKRSIDLGLRDELLFRTMWDVALLEKKLARPLAALQVFTDLAACRNPFRVKALEELAKHYERSERNYSLSLEFVLQALVLEPTASLERRRRRLEKRLAGPTKSAAGKLFKQT
jgi:uncharacterized protein